MNAYAHIYFYLCECECVYDWMCMCRPCARVRVLYMYVSSTLHYSSLSTSAFVLSINMPLCANMHASNNRSLIDLHVFACFLFYFVQTCYLCQQITLMSRVAMAFISSVSCCSWCTVCLVALSGYRTRKRIGLLSLTPALESLCSSFARFQTRRCHSAGIAVKAACFCSDNRMMNDVAL